MFRLAPAILLTLAACGRTTPYEAALAEVGVFDAGAGGGGGMGGGMGGGPGGGGGVIEIPPGCEANDVKFTGAAPQPAPAGIPRIQISLPPGSGLSGSAPWFDFSTALVSGVSNRAGTATISFEGVAVKVRIAPGDSAAVLADRLVRCGRVPGYRFETTAPPNTFIGVRRADTRIFARVFVENSHLDPRFVFEDPEGIPYWLAVVERFATHPLMLSARGKPICGGGAAGRDPSERRLATKQGVLFSWDGTHFLDGGSCLTRELYDGGTLTLIACSRLTSTADAGGDPFTRADAGMNVDCISQESALGPSAPGAPTAIVFNW